nr:probable F-box protein At4g22060 isoform X2 [Lolium perenne]
MKAPAPDWSELPVDIMCDVLKLLECPDLVRSAAVCRLWYNAYSIARRIGICLGHQTPCLLYCTEADGLKALGMYSLSERKTYTIPLPEPPILNWIGSSDGWLVTMDQKSELMLLNPITGNMIALPPVTTMEHVKPLLNDDGVLERYEVSYYDGQLPRVEDARSTFSLDEYGDLVYLKATLSGDPLVGECIVMLIHEPYMQLSFAKVGDTHWNWLNMHSYYSDCIYHAGWFYAMADEGAIDAYNLNEPSVIHKRLLPKILRTVSKCHIVQAGWGDVLQIIRKETYNYEQPEVRKYVTEFQVYKVDFDEKKRVKMTGIGDHALFVGKSTTSCFSIKDYPDLMPNHIYFTEDHEGTQSDHKDETRDMGVYSIENNTTTHVVYPELWMNWLPPIWLTPSLAKTGIDLLVP